MTWISHTRMWKKGRNVHEFTFQCDPCKRQYLFKDDKLFEKRKRRDLFAEDRLVLENEIKDAIGRRCFTCGGPIEKGNGGCLLSCGWCDQEYTVNDGQLQPKIDDRPQPKPTLREFYALHK